LFSSNKGLYEIKNDTYYLTMACSWIYVPNTSSNYAREFDTMTNEGEVPPDDEWWDSM
jgi:hypothetical protein